MDNTQPLPDDRRVNQYTTTDNGPRFYDGAGRLAAEDWEGTFHHWQFYDWAGRLGWNERGGGQNPVYANYISDPMGRPAQESTWVGGGTPTPVYRVHSGAHEIEERDATGENVLATFVHGAHIDEVVQSSRGSNFYWHHTDDLGNTLCVTDKNWDVAERYDYQDFGWPEVYSEEGYWRPASAPGIQNPFLFNGRRWDSVAQQYDYRTRRLDPRAGRFTTRDIIGTWGDPYNDGNSSTYVGNNPWSWVDPFGLVRKRQDGVIVDNDGVVIGPLPWDDEETALPPFTPDHVAEVLKEIQIAIALEVATFGLAKAISGAVQAARAAKACNRAGHGAESAANGLRLNNSLASEAQMSEVGQIIAGVGAKKGFRGAPRIARTFGGRPEDWVKKSSSTYKTRDGVLFETHWLENIKTGQKVEFKTKFPGKI